MELEQGQGPGRTPVCPGGPRPLSATAARPMFSSSRGKDEIQGLPFGRCDVGMPQIHHENHPWAVLRRTFMERGVQERIIEEEAAAFCPALGLPAHHQLTATRSFQT